jgi:hypothetical protein
MVSNTKIDFFLDFHPIISTDESGMTIFYNYGLVLMSLNFSVVSSS